MAGPLDARMRAFISMRAWRTESASVRVSRITSLGAKPPTSRSTAAIRSASDSA